jgi:hypothetical protein
MTTTIGIRHLALFAAAAAFVAGCGSSSSDDSAGDGTFQRPNQARPVHYAVMPAPARLVNDVAGYASAPSGCAEANGADCDAIMPQTADAKLLAWMPLEQGATPDRGYVVALMLFKTRTGHECVDVVEANDGRSSDIVSCVSTLSCSNLCFSQHRRDPSRERFIGGIAVPNAQELEIKDGSGQRVLHDVGPAEEGIDGRRAFLVQAPFRARSVSVFDREGEIVARW